MHEASRQIRVDNTDINRGVNRSKSCTVLQLVPWAALVIALVLVAVTGAFAGSVGRVVDGDDLCLCGDDAASFAALLAIARGVIRSAFGFACAGSTRSS